ncbi:hypothetical protein H0H92_005326 [Tricholoma furcatifolium]|nr:hypothetical protein H0H92_005326 [Tricholoma furcatifolium]
MPLGIITLEDVLEELIGEEIYDEFDPQGARGDPYQVPPETKVEFPTGTGTIAAPTAAPATATAPIAIEAGSGPAPGPEPATIVKPAPLYMPTALKNLTGLGLSGFLRPKSAPPVPRDPETEKVPTPMPMPMPVAASIPPSPQPQVPLGEDGPQGTVVGTGARAGAGAERRPSLPSGQSAPASQHGHGHAGHASVDSTRPSTAHSVGGGAPVALPLEAVLLERKRRLAAGGGSISGGAGVLPGMSVGVQAVPVEPMAGVGAQGGVGVGGGVGPGPGLQATRSMIVPGPKGTRFKSSPLVEGEVAVPVVVKPGEEGPGAAE